MNKNSSQNIFLILLITLKLSSENTNSALSLDNINIRHLNFLDYLLMNKNKKI